MQRILTIAALWLWALTFSAAAQGFQDIVEDADRGMGRVLVPVALGTSLGSGFVVGKGSAEGTYFFVTNEHVIDGGSEILVRFLHEGRVITYRATKMKVSAPFDMALLQLSGSDDTSHEPHIFPIADFAPNKGEPVAAIGFPSIADADDVSMNDARFYETTFTQGAASKIESRSWRPSAPVLQVIQHTADINKGNSGGALLNECGHVIGVNTQGRPFQGNSRLPGSGTFYASSGPALLQFLSGTASTHTTTSSCSPGGFGDMSMWLLAAGGALALVSIGALVAVNGMPGSAGRGGGGIIVINRKNEKPEPVAPEPPKKERKHKSGGKVLFISAPAVGMTGPLGFTTEQLRSGITIGRSSSATVTIDNAALSRNHAKLMLVDRRLMVSDLSSSNGTTVDGQKLAPNEPRQVNTSTKVELGGVPLHLERKKK